MSDNAGVESIVQDARNAFLGRLGWHDGHADVWRVFNDADAFAAIVAGLAEPWRGRDVTKVCGIESRGFLLGGPVAIALGAGFVAMRKRDALFPGPKYEVEACGGSLLGMSVIVTSSTRNEDERCRRSRASSPRTTFPTTRTDDAN
ncbi:MAG: phosphoribosyltransferase [Actinomycetia bacterium]|jgi:hypothetical protein|nr:phosphoribosyltransferase [Actinomycetes bacterium]MDQ1461696.1 adenine phosphoribosyltransferase [Actinomycetota bacterium]